MEEGILSLKSCMEVISYSVIFESRPNKQNSFLKPQYPLLLVTTYRCYRMMTNDKRHCIDTFVAIPRLRGLPVKRDMSL